MIVKSSREDNDIDNDNDSTDEDNDADNDADGPEDLVRKTSWELMNESQLKASLEWLQDKESLPFTWLEEWDKWRLLLRSRQQEQQQQQQRTISKAHRRRIRKAATTTTKTRQLCALCVLVRIVLQFLQNQFPSRTFDPIKT